MKKSLAGFEASFKTDKANWGAELEGARYEVSYIRVGLACHWAARHFEQSWRVFEMKHLPAGHRLSV